MKLWRTVAALIACAGGVALVALWSHHRQVKQWSTTQTRAEHGDAKAQFDVASAYYLGRGVSQDYAEALRWYRMAADRGEPGAEDALGYMYLKGQGVPQDYAQAFQWYRRAAEHGDRKGQFDLGKAYDEGVGVQSDYIEASRWYRKAADQNYAKGEDALGYMYYAGRGLPQDLSQAFFWYRKAAEQGYAKAEYDLACMYYKGVGTAQDYSEARRWYIKAAKKGNADGKQALGLFGTQSSTVTKLEYLELVPSLALGLWVLVAFVVHRGNILEWRQAALLLLGVSLLAVSGMNLYVIAHGGLGYCTYPVAFRVVKRVLIGTAVLIIVTVVLPAKKKPNALPRAT
jgi:TPR repeat protein